MAASVQTHREGDTLVLRWSSALPHHPSPEACAAAVEALIAADSSPEVRSLVLVGDGAHFWPDTQAWHGGQRPAAVVGEQLDAFEAWIDALSTCSKPVLAAVHGDCMGLGWALALACDGVVAERAGRFGVGPAGTPPLGGVGWRLARDWPRPLAMAALMAGETFDAPRLWQLGWVNRLCEPGQALAQTLDWAASMHTVPPATLSGLKALVAQAPARTWAQHLPQERAHLLRHRR